MDVNRCIVVGIYSSYPSSSGGWIQQSKTKKSCIAVTVGQQQEAFSLQLFLGTFNWKHLLINRQIILKTEISRKGKNPVWCIFYRIQQWNKG